jgi:hypothetical protein
MNPFRDTKRLGYILGNIETLSPDSLLYVSGNVEEVDASTLCMPISLDSEKPEDVQWFIRGNSLKEFLSASDLQDILENLRLQTGTFTESDLIAAVNFYWKNDAFIETAI